MILSSAFDFLLTNCKDVVEVKELAKKNNVVEKLDQASMPNHFFFMDKDNNKVVLEPKNGKLIVYDNPFNTLTNAPDFNYHLTNMKKYIHLTPSNVDEQIINDYKVIKLGEGSGMLGIPGDFTPPSRFVRAAYFVGNTPKDLDRESAILQGFRILSQFDIPKGAVYDPIKNHFDETLYTSIMDTTKLSYHIKANNNINIQSFSLNDYTKHSNIVFIEINKTMNL